MVRREQRSQRELKNHQEAHKIHWIEKGIEAGVHLENHILWPNTFSPKGVVSSKFITAYSGYPTKIRLAVIGSNQDICT